METSLKNLKTSQITALAFRANCSAVYVRQVIDGTRASNTIRSKAILASAKILSDAIINAHKKVNVVFEKIEDNN